MSGDAVDPSLLRAIISQGGFAVLAFVVIYLGYLGNKRWTDDLKAAAERERNLSAKVLDLAAAVATSLSNNTSAIAALTSEISGLRATMHKVAGMQSSVETRLHIVESKMNPGGGR